MHNLSDFISPELPTTIKEISPNDLMFKSDPKSYFDVGPSALTVIKLAMLHAGKEDFSNILDLPCGHGRVLRTLRAAFPYATITACDLDADGVTFCSKMFDATPLYSAPDPRDIKTNQRFDLIWCGSLLTHLDAPLWTPFLEFFESHLTRGGLLIFTVHGWHYIRRFESGLKFHITSQDKLAQDFEEKGFGYQNYLDQSSYGISLASPAWTCKLIETATDLQLVNYSERAWCGHHDVIACRKPVSEGLVGHLEVVTSDKIGGWAWNREEPDEAAPVEILADGRVLRRVQADRFRGDLEAAKIRNGNSAFSIETPRELNDGRPHKIIARFAGTNIQLSNSPKILKA